MQSVPKLLLGLMLMVGWALPGWSQPQDGKAVLEKMTKTYAGLKSYQDRTTVITTIKAPGFDQKTESAYDVAVQRPDKLAVRNTDQTDLTTVYDGTKQWTYTPLLNEYMVQPAPSSISDLLGAQGEQGPGVGIGQGAVLLAMFAPDALANIMRDVQKVEVVGEETRQDALTIHVRPIHPDMAVDYWIGKEDALLRAFTIVVSSSNELGTQRTLFEERHEQIKANQATAPEQFIFQVPQGASQTNDIFADMAKHMGGTEDGGSPLVGQKAPAFSVERLGGGTAKSADWAGKVVVLNFWISVYGPSRNELALLQDVYSTYKDKNVVFLTINGSDDQAAVEALLKDKGFTLPVALDPQEKVIQLYSVAAYPTLVLVGKDGVVQKVHEGFTQEVEAQLRPELDALLAGESPRK